MLLLALIVYWWLNNTGADYAAIAGEDINWEPGYNNYTGINVTILVMGDGARLNHTVYNGRGVEKEFLDGFYNTLQDIPPEPLNLSQSISQASLALSSGTVDALGTTGVAPRSNVASYYFFDNNGNHENLQYVICHHTSRWKVGLVAYQYDHCQGSRFCRYVEPDDFTQQMASKCLYNPSGKNTEPKAFVVPVEYKLSSDVIFSPPARWPLFFTIAGTNNRGLPLDHGSEGAGIFMSCPCADRASIPAASVLENTAKLENFTTPNASAAIFAGGLAILYQQNENYTIPDLMFITAMTADKNHPGSLLWSKNSFGLNFNRRQGFGRLNLKKAVDLGENWESVGNFYSTAQQKTGINEQMGEGSINFTFNFDGDEDDTVISLQLSLDAKELGFGSLNPHVHSPDGTDSEMKILSESDRELNVEHVELPSYKFLGDRLKGTWTVEFKQIDDANRGILTNVNLTIFYVKKRPSQSLIDQEEKANPFTPIPPKGFAFDVEESTMEATKNWSVGITYPEHLRGSSYILMYIQNHQNTTRMKIKAKFNKDFTKITLDYVPSVFRNGIPMFFVVESLDNEKLFSAHLKINYVNPFDPGVILLEAADNDKCRAVGKPNKPINSTNIPINKKCLVVYYALNLSEITDDGYSSSITNSIITQESKTILNRTFFRNTGEIIWKDIVPANRLFLFQLSPTSSARFEHFDPITVTIEVLPHDGVYTLFESPYTLTLLIAIICCFAVTLLIIGPRLFAILKRKITGDAEDDNELMRERQV
jgi:proprotein convertase subtilisin/kexin type 2